MELHQKPVHRNPMFGGGAIELSLQIDYMHALG